MRMAGNLRISERSSTRSTIRLPDKLLGVVLTYADRQKAIAMFVDTGATVSKIALGDAIEIDQLLSRIT